MPNYNGFRGALRILSIEINGAYLPVACLESHDFSEEVDMLPTTTRETGGWETSLPVTQRYSLDFSGFQINTAFPGADGLRVSYDYLILLKRQKQRINWRIESTDDNQLVESGQGYITTLSENASTEEMVSFAGNIIGYAIISPFLPVISNLNPLNGALLNLTEGAGFLALNITYPMGTVLILGNFISGTLTNTTTAETFAINSGNASLAASRRVDVLLSGNFIGVAGIYTVQLDAGYVYDTISGGAAPEITANDWSFEVGTGDYDTVDYDTTDYFTN